MKTIRDNQEQFSELMNAGLNLVCEGMRRTITVRKDTQTEDLLVKILKTEYPDERPGTEMWFTKREFISDFGGYFYAR